MHVMTYQWVSEQEESRRTGSSVYYQKGTGATPTSDDLVLGECFYLSTKKSTEDNLMLLFHFDKYIFSIMNTITEKVVTCKQLPSRAVWGLEMEMK